MSIRKSLMLSALMAAAVQRGIEYQKAREAAEPKADAKNIVQTNWQEDVGKKNTETKPCNRCQIPFFGLRKRKYCWSCEKIVAAHRETLAKANSDRRPAG